MYQNNLRISNELTMLLLSVVVFGVVISTFFGAIIEQGNHESLMAANGFYTKLYNSQFAQCSVTIFQLLTALSKDSKSIEYNGVGIGTIRAFVICPKTNLDKL